MRAGLVVSQRNTKKEQLEKLFLNCTDWKKTVEDEITKRRGGGNAGSDRWGLRGLDATQITGRR